MTMGLAPGGTAGFYPAAMPDLPIDPLDPRVALAAERTLLAWIRTGIALMGLGFVVARFGLFLREIAAASAQLAPGRSSASMTGAALVGAGILLNVWASVRHAAILQRLARGETNVVSPSGPVALGVATCVGGIVVLAVLLGAC